MFRPIGQMYCRMKDYTEDFLLPTIFEKEKITNYVLIYKFLHGSHNFSEFIGLTVPT